MLEGLLLAAGLATGGAIGFAIAWTAGARAREDLAALSARAEEQERAAADKLAHATNMRRELADAFKALSAQALDSTSATFLQLATATLEKHQVQAQGELEARQKAVDALVQPIKDSLTKVDGKLGEIERTRINAYSALHTQLRGLIEVHLPQLHNETANLVKALRQPTVRGHWGEMQLKRALEVAGMLEHCDYLQQPTATTEDGRQTRPDVVVKLAGGRHVVIDAKVPLSAYLEAAEATDDDARAAHLARHARLVREHVKSLSAKAYWDTFSPSPDFVILFLPGEMLYSAALEQDPALIEAGAAAKVMLATPTTLITLLRTVALGWREQTLALNAQEVADLGRQLYDRIGTLAGYWHDVGDRLGKTVESYNKSVGALESRVLVSARKFEELKAAPDGGKLESPEPIETVPRLLQAPELTTVRDGVIALERPLRVS